MKTLNKHTVVVAAIAISFIMSLVYLAQKAHAEQNNNLSEQQLQAFLEDLEGFTQVFGDIKQLYVDEVDDKKLFIQAIKGMVNALDPHSSYLEPEDQKELLENATGKFSGLGIVIGMKDEVIQIISPIDDTPAYRAGIKAGDLIIKIDDRIVRGMTLEESVKLMRGRENTSVTLTITRGNNPPFTVDIVRKVITITSVKGYLLEDDIAYIRISNFQGPTARLLSTTISDLTRQNGDKLKGMVIDLRNNPGGILRGAIDVADMFLDSENLIVYTKGRIPNSNLRYNSTPGDIIDGAPLAVLINEGSASASEIVAGALQDYKRAIVMGSTSFGKGSVQTVVDLADGYGLKITTARYYTPKGRSIQAKGIEPDIALDTIDLASATTDEEEPDRTTEQDLEGHLEAVDPSSLSQEEILKSQEESKITQANEAVEVLKKDYFVHEATNLIKALIFLEK